jgi:4-amino-4-deoxy-L-arabinose transferase-like glycosyltransferase
MDWAARHRWRALLLLLGLCAALFFYGLSAGDLYRTENLRAIIAADFLRSGNWVVPKLYGEPLFTKPPGMYAAIALASWPFGGVSTWTARLPSAVAATLTVLLVYWYFGRQLGRVGGLLAACLLPTSVMWLDKVPTAEIDALQVAWVTAAIVFFLRALDDEEETARLSEPPLNDKRGRLTWVWWLAALLCVAAGFLTKWTAPAFFYGTAVPLLWWRGRLRLLFGRGHLAGAALAAAVCLGWAGLAVALSGWDAFSETVSREALQRLSPGHHLEALQQLSPDHQPQVYPWVGVLLHPVRTLASGLPWSAFALVALWPGFARLWDERGRRLLQALHCWAWPNLLFWSVIPEHAQRHSFPLFPALSGLAAMVWLAWLSGRLRWPVPRLRPQDVAIGLLGLWLVVKIGFVEGWVPSRNRDRAPRAKGEQLAAVVPAGQPLYVFHLKDEGIMFYYGHQHPAGDAGVPVRRLPGLTDLPSQPEPLYCILDEAEWLAVSGPFPVLPDGVWESLLYLSDEQGEPIVLVKMSRPPAGLANGGQEVSRP